MRLIILNSYIKYVHNIYSMVFSLVMECGYQRMSLSVQVRQLCSKLYFSKKNIFLKSTRLIN